MRPLAPSPRCYAHHYTVKWQRVLEGMSAGSYQDCEVPGREQRLILASPVTRFPPPVM